MRLCTTKSLNGLGRCSCGHCGGDSGGRILQGLVAGAEGADPLTIALMIAVLAAAALAASLAPARQASRVDPMTAFRQE